MRIIDVRTFTGDRPWQAVDVEAIDDATVRVHWTDQPYHWHVNDGPEVFVVLDGRVDMSVRVDGRVETHTLEPGTIFHAEAGDEHVAHPVGAARILVVERRGSE
ncbi:cupin domain-containing protein [Nocardioides sp. TF02-7]|uniref:cupin domain-containing protein n=1 Tax=Nocardioides sp. TF02-7 TaxID=2917724 RepID=UPI001F06FCB6|nr:cupin domain-containing protein [Nocardioides sp. TF02-7]UMG94419.1 cupin domain-containing protein [Nocardioides sp. TF02-7]